MAWPAFPLSVSTKKTKQTKVQHYSAFYKYIDIYQKHMTWNTWKSMAILSSIP